MRVTRRMRKASQSSRCGAEDGFENDDENASVGSIGEINSAERAPFSRKFQTGLSFETTTYCFNGLRKGVNVPV